MATTTNYGWTTPDDTALVKDGAAAIRTLGSSVDTTTKALNPSTTLGDIEYRSSTANTNTRLGVGTTGQVLTIAGGVPSWATPTSGSMTLLNTGGTTLSGASITISSIPATYRDIRIVVQNFRPATDAVQLGLRYNGDSGANYRAIGASVNNTGAIGDNNVSLCAETDNGTSISLMIAQINEYANTTTYKFHFSDAIINDSTTPANINYRRSVGVWGSSSAINSITVFPTSGNFTSGTIFVYGVN
jgi:hypothetical protein